MNSIYKHEVAGCIRYIGETSRSPEARLAEHLKEARGRGNYKKLNWLRSLDAPPIVGVIELVSPENAAAREIYWIALARDYGCRLVNITPGGEGLGSGAAHPMFGRKHPPEIRELISEAGRRPCPDETRLKISEAQRGEKNHRFGKTNSKQQCAAVSAALIGRPFSPDHRAKINEALRSPEVREKASAAKRGKLKSPQTRSNMRVAQQLRRFKEKN